jgi:transcriptional regulator with XRE-family HTH domain
MLRIAEARAARGWSQEQLAEAVGTTQQTLQRWESGRVDPQVGKIEAISAALGVTMSYLLGVDVPEHDDALSPDERRLVELYRMSDARGRASIMRTAVGEAGVERELSGGMNDVRTA